MFENPLHHFSVSERLYAFHWEIIPHSSICSRGTSKFSCKDRQIAPSGQPQGSRGWSAAEPPDTVPETTTPPKAAHKPRHCGTPLGCRLLLHFIPGVRHRAIRTVASPPATLCAAVGGKEYLQNFDAPMFSMRFSAVLYSDAFSVQ